MRIVLLSYRGNMYCGGQGVYVYYLSKHLSKLGHKVHLIQGPPYTWDTPWCEVHKLKDFNLFATRKFFFRNIHSQKEMFELFSPLNFYEFMMTRLGFFPEMLAFSFRAYFKICELLKKERIDIIHDNQTLGFGLPLLNKALGLPLVATIHHPLSEDQKADFQQLPGFNDRLRRVVYYPLLMHRIVTPLFDDLITVSQTARRSISRATGLAMERIKVVYNGVDTELFKPDPKVKKIKKRLIFVGNTEDRKKGIRYLLEAMLYLPKDVTLSVVDGGAPRHIVMDELSRRYNIKDRVYCTGKISTQELVRRYQESEVAVVPSVYEGFGFPLAEAMSCGLACVSTDGGALPEVVGTDGKAGLVVPRENARALAVAIKTLLDSERLRLEMGRRARERIESKFSWDKCAREIVKIYEENIIRSRRVFNRGKKPTNN